MSKVYRVFGVLWLLSGNLTQAEIAPLTAPEAAMVTWIDANTESAIALIEKTVNINSGTLNTAGVKAVADQLIPELQNLELATEWIPLPATMNRGGHLFAARGGEQGKKLLLIGHLDTVFEANDAFQRFERDGDWAAGPGISDMKAGNVIMIYALKALQSVNALDNTQLQLVFTGDEESHGEPLAIARGRLIEAGHWADIALGFESGMRFDGKEWATISRRSASEWCLEVSGRQAHSSGIFSVEAGAGAIFEAARILKEFYDEVRGEAYLTFNAGTILGGTEVAADCESPSGSVFGKTNVIPQRVVVRGGMRTISDAQLETARGKMRDVVARNLPVTSAEIQFRDGYPAMSPTAGNRRLHAMLSDINEALGGDAMPILDPSRRGAADISFVAPYTDGLAGLGAYGEGEHSPAERLDLRSLPNCYQAGGGINLSTDALTAGRTQAS